MTVPPSPWPGVTRSASYPRHHGPTRWRGSMPPDAASRRKTPALPAERPEGQAVDRLERWRPRDAAGGERPFPRAEAAGLEGQPQPLVALAQHALDALRLPDERRDRQRGDGHRSQEDLEQEQRHVGGGDDEGAEALAGADYGDGREQDEERRREARSEAERGPEKRRQTEVRQRVVRQVRHEVAEDEVRDDGGRAHEQQRLERPVTGADARRAPAAREQQERRGDDGARALAGAPPQTDTTT